jgi:phosphohistidine phosphatase SixA
MTKIFAFRRIAAAAILLTGIGVALFGADLADTTADTLHIGLLALGFPKLATGNHCDGLCSPARKKKTTDYPAVTHFLGGPKRIILMRHADKTEDSADEDLSESGWARAKQLATYLPETFGKPDIIMAAAQSKHSDRSVETVKPLAESLGLEIQDYFKNDEFPQLVDEIFNDPDYKNKTVVICWHHGKLPAMASLLGAPAGSFPDPWPSNAYNLILDLQYDPFSGAPPKVTRITEPF